MSVSSVDVIGRSENVVVVDSDWSSRKVALIALCLAFLAMVLLASFSRMPLGQYWWDNLALAGGAIAVLDGGTPSVDFYSPLIIPLYIKAASIFIFGYASHYFVECVAQALIIALIFSYLILPSVKRSWAFLLLLLLVACAGIPANHSNVITSEPGYLNYAGGYNRLCDSLLGLAFLTPLLDSESRRHFVLCEAICIGAVLFIAFFTKISAFQIIAIYFCFVPLLGDRGFHPKTLVGGYALFGVLVFFVWFFLGIGPDYILELKRIAAMKSMGASSDILMRMQGFLDRHWFELAIHFILILGVCLYFWLASIFNKKRVIALFLFLMALGGNLLFTITNYGDMGLLPASFACFSLIAVIKEPGRPIFGGVREYVARNARKILWALFALLLLSDVFFYQRWLAGFFRLGVGQSQSVTVVEDEFFRDNYVLRVWGSPRLLKDQDPSLVIRHKPSDYVRYVSQLSEASLYLKTISLSSSKSVYALDFPAYVFSLMSGHRIPKGSYPWLLFNHELNQKSHPDPNRLFGDVDVLARSLCSLHAPNRDQLFNVYKDYIREHFEVIGGTECWRFMKKRGSVDPSPSG